MACVDVLQLTHGAVATVSTFFWTLFCISNQACRFGEMSSCPMHWVWYSYGLLLASHNCTVRYIATSILWKEYERGWQKQLWCCLRRLDLVKVGKWQAICFRSFGIRLWHWNHLRLMMTLTGSASFSNCHLPPCLVECNCIQIYYCSHVWCIPMVVRNILQLAVTDPITCKQDTTS